MTEKLIQRIGKIYNREFGLFKPMTFRGEFGVYDSDASRQELIKRLHEYEKSGFSPEVVQQIAKELFEETNKLSKAICGLEELRGYLMGMDIDPYPETAVEDIENLGTAIHLLRGLPVEEEEERDPQADSSEEEKIQMQKLCESLPKINLHEEKALETYSNHQKFYDFKKAIDAALEIFSEVTNKPETKAEEEKKTL